MSSDIILTLEAAWQEIQSHHPELPAVVLVTGRRRQKSEAKTRGQHCADVWRTDDDTRASEVVLFGERLADGGREVMNTLIHEAVHELCKARGIKDTSNRGRYHNKEFAAGAQIMGLEPPDVSGGPHFGYSDCKITEETCEKYATMIKRLDRACQMYVAPKLEDKVKVKRQQRRAQCECPEGQNEIPWSKKTARKAELSNGIICGACRRPFEEIEE